MVDYRHLLRKPAEEIKRPPSLPGGTYFGVVSKWEFGESSQKKTPQLQFTLDVKQAGEDISPEDLLVDGAPMEIQKKNFRETFYLTDDALFRLKEFVESFGHDLTGRTIDEVLPELQNAPVMMTVIQKPRDNPEEGFFNQLTKVVGIKS